MLTVDRAQVIAHRVARHGLHRTPGALDPLLDLGLQSSGPTAVLALTARSADVTTPDSLGLAAGWTHRGAPHHHRPGDLPALAAASRPLSDADAAARLAWSGPEQRRVGIPAAEAIDRAADALSEIVTSPMTKGAASAEITKRLPDVLLRDCRPCGCVHVNEQLMRLAALPAGVGLDVTGSTLLLTPTDGWVRPTTPAPALAAELVVAYLAVLGPAGPAEAAGFAGSSPKAFAAAWAAALPQLVEVLVDGRRAWLPAGDAGALADPPEPDVVRLLPPFDPFLQLRDRPLLVPDADRRSELYRALGNPGATLADGEVVATWRARASGGKLSITVTPFDRLPPAVRAAVDDEARRVAAARGLTLEKLVVT